MNWMFVSCLRIITRKRDREDRIKQDRPPWGFESWKEVVIKLITPPVFMLFAFFFLSHTQTHTGSLFLPSSFTHSLTHTGWCTSPFFCTWGSEEGQGDAQSKLKCSSECFLDVMHGSRDAAWPCCYTCKCAEAHRSKAVAMTLQQKPSDSYILLTQVASKPTFCLDHVESLLLFIHLFFYK